MYALCTGPLLPAVGKSSWAIEVDNFNIDLWIGVCDAARRNSWALSLGHGWLYREQRDAHGHIAYPPPPPPDGWPDGEGKQVMKDEAGEPTDLWDDQATGAVIQVLVDHDEGVLSFQINGGPVLEALKGFPKGTAGQVRPWVFLDDHRCDYEAIRLGGGGGYSLRFVRPYL